MPPDILDSAEENTIGLAVWAQTQEAAEVGIEWKVNYLVDSSFDPKFDGKYLRPGWTPARRLYQ